LLQAITIADIEAAIEKGRKYNPDIIGSSYLITSDIQYLRNQAKESIKEYTTEYLPEQHQVCLTALDAIIKRAFDILETSPDNREKLQAMELFKSLVGCIYILCLFTSDLFMKGLPHFSHLSITSNNLHYISKYWV
jgi:hypothetical protein